MRCCQQAPLDQFHQASTVRGSSSCTAPAQRSLRQQLLAIRIGSRGQTNLWLACWTDPSRDQRDICFGHLRRLLECHALLHYHFFSRILRLVSRCTTWLLEIVAFQMLLSRPPARIRVILLTPWCLLEDRLDDLLHPPGCFARIPNKPKPGKNTSVKRQATLTFSSSFYVAFFFMSDSRLP